MMDNAVMTGNPMVGRMPTDSAGDSSTSSSAVLRLQRQSCLGKAIGPFDGDNNNNDGDMLDDQGLKQDEFFRQKIGGSIMTDLADVVTDLTCKTRITDHNSMSGSSTSVPLVSSIKRHGNITKSRESINSRNRKSIPEAQKVPNSRGLLSEHAGGSFDVFNIETALPKLEWDVTEARLRAAKDEEKRRRNDREEIRRRLAMGIEADEVTELEKLTKKPTLHSRLRNASDGSDTEIQQLRAKDSQGELIRKKSPFETRAGYSNASTTKNGFLSLPPSVSSTRSEPNPQSESFAQMDFFSQQAKLQSEARTALAQAKELARVQMQVERQQRKHARISDLVRQSLVKLGIPFPWECRRLSRQILTELNIAQLQVIVNDLHTQIEGLNEELVQLLLKRDDCHMEQDSMLVDIEDLTRYLTAKQVTLDPTGSATGPVSLPIQEKLPPLSTKQRLHQSLARIPGVRK